MKLGGQMDYHGSRAYAPDHSSSADANWVKRQAGRLSAWAKRALESLLRPGAEQAAQTIWLVRGDERHFSVLGSDRDTKRLRDAASPWPFPEREARSPDRQTIHGK
jgi:hypothetical protein